MVAGAGAAPRNASVRSGGVIVAARMGQVLGDVKSYYDGETDVMVGEVLG